MSSSRPSAAPRTSHEIAYDARVSSPVVVAPAIAIAAACAMLGACRDTDPGLQQGVVATTGGQPATGVTVLSHRADGTALDRQVADATGRAVIATEVGGYATVVFPATIEPSTPSIEAITAPLPAMGDLVIAGPPPSKPPAVAGALAITAPALVGADDYDVDLGCVTIRVATMPATVNVAAACLGSDANLDVIVRGVQATAGDDLVVGYSAGRVELVGGVAMFDIAAWDTGGTAIPVTLDGVTAKVTLDITTDRLTYPTLPVTDHATLWTGFAVDSTTVTANQGFATLGEITTRTMAGAPAAIAFGPDDFLPELESVVLLDDRATVAIRWSPAGFVADSLDLHVTWTAGVQAVTWDALLPADADHVRLPALDADLSFLVPGADITSDLRAIVTRPDEVLTSHTTGFR